MADKCHICLLGLIFVCPLLTAGVEETHLFCNSGENAILPCNKVLSDCKSTTWTYNGHKTSVTVELFNRGIKNNGIERHERLSLGSDCSLNIYKVTKEDYGLYFCRQYVNEQQQGNDAFIYLHFLHVSVSPASTQTEIRPGSSLTLSCHLYVSDGYSCDSLVRFDGIQLFWVNQADVNLQSDSRYQISPSSSSHCSSTLTTTLLNEDNNREWRCLITKQNEVKTSDNYTVKYLDPVNTSPLKTTPNSEITSTTQASVTTPQVTVISIVIVALAVLLTAVLLWLIYRKKADNRRETDRSVVTAKKENIGTNNPINISIQPIPFSINEQTDDVTYSDVTVLSKTQVKKKGVYSDDKVTYAAIGGAKATHL